MLQKFSISRIFLSSYVREYACNSEAVRFTDMHALDCVFTEREGCILLRDTDVGGWVKGWWHSSGCFISVSYCVDSKVDCPLARSNGDIEYKKDIWMVCNDLMSGHYPNFVGYLSCRVVSLGNSLRRFFWLLDAWLQPRTSSMGEWQEHILRMDSRRIVCHSPVTLSRSLCRDTWLGAVQEGLVYPGLRSLQSLNTI